MATTKKTSKPAAPAGKKAKKTAKPFNPIILRGETGMIFPSDTAAALIGTLPTSKLKEMLRSRQLPIPKDKDTMVDRLVTWAVRQNATFVLSLH